MVFSPSPAEHVMNLALCGLGKAGTEFIRYLLNSPDCRGDELTAVLCRPTSPTLGKTVAETTKIILPEDLTITSVENFDAAALPADKRPDVIIDFSASETTFKLLELCARQKINLVICPNDFSAAQIEEMKKITTSSGIGVVYAPTLTPGVNLLINFVEHFSRAFPDYNFEIVEKHSRHKKKPSRTAEYIGEAIQRDEVPIHSLRLDGYTGIHEATATDGLERITIEHESLSRAAFARGALYAARFIKGKSGFYTLKEIFKQS